MGSSKKHKGKDRDEMRESRKRHRDYRSRSRSPKERRSHNEKEKRRERRDRSRERENRGDRKRIIRDDHSPVPEKRLKEDSRDVSIPEPKSSGGDISLSIEETNKIRIRLGLKPLETNDKSESTEGGSNPDKDFVHKPAENLGDKKFVERMREKIAAQREKRLVEDKLKKVKGLANSDSENEDSAATWVNKSRTIQNEKEQAEKRAKLLEEMDEEFGVGNLVEDEFKAAKQQAYSARDLKGMRVEHAHNRFQEGRITVLTIKDKGILEDGDDVLVNVNLIDDERAEKNVEIKKGKPGYVPFDDPQFDEFGELKKDALLSKYDEEIDGEQRTSFTIGSSGDINLERERQRQIVRAKLKQSGVETLELPTPTLMTEYFTEEEMVKFKKPKKVRKVRRKVLKADELLTLTHEERLSRDLGTRSRPGRKSKPQIEVQIKKEQNDDDMDIDPVEFDETEILGPDEDLTGYTLEQDEAQLELQLALSKARKLKNSEDIKPTPDELERYMEAMQEETSQDSKSMELPFEKSTIILNSTAEFCRALGDIPTYGLSGNRDEEAEELADLEREMADERAFKDNDLKQDANKGSWNQIDPDEKPLEFKKEDATILEEEPDVGTGIAGALQLALKKGYLEQETKKVVSAPRHSTLQAASYTIEDKSFMDDDKFGRRERYSAGPVSDFKDKDLYRPDVKLEYIDDSGRLLNPKEAFRYLSHKFHGKGSGKNKTEKRVKKQQEEALMKQMSSTDTPLGTLALLQEKQKQTQSPFIVLSGGSKAFNTNAIAKSK